MNDEVKVLDMTHADEVIREVEGGAAPTMQSRMGTGGNQVPLVMGVFNQQGSKGTGHASTEDTSPTLGHCNTSVDVHAVAIGLDRRNQAGADEVQPALQSSVSDGGSTVCVGLKYLQSAKSQAPYSIGIAQASSAGAHDAAVAIGFKAGQSANGGLGEEAEVSPTMSHQPSALEPTVCIDAYNQSATEESCMTLRSAMTGTDGNDADPKVVTNGVATMLKVRCGKDTYTKPDGSTGTAGKGPLASEESAFTLAATQDQSLVLRHIVRRLTPIECERLMALPDNYTRIPYRGKSADQCPDSPRYKALGNSWATNCAEWILRRIVAAVRLGMIGDDQ